MQTSIEPLPRVIRFGLSADENELGERTLDWGELAIEGRFPVGNARVTAVRHAGSPAPATAPFWFQVWARAAMSSA
jgi:hypothetical protein